MKFYLLYLKKKGITLTGVPRYIGPHVSFDDFRKISLGDRIVISDHCILLTHDYSLTTALISVNQAPPADCALIRGIKIGNNVFIGKRCIIMPGCEIPDNVIIGAGSVIRGKLESGYIYFGNPAVKGKEISEQLQKWEKYRGTEVWRID